MPPPPYAVTQGKRFSPNKDVRATMLVMYSFSESAEEVAKLIREHLAESYDYCNVLPSRRYTWSSGNHYDYILIVFAQDEGWGMSRKLAKRLEQWAPKEHALLPIVSYPVWKSRFCNRSKMRHQYLTETVAEALKVLGF